jgi:hypothetical protein
MDGRNIGVFWNGRILRNGQPRVRWRLLRRSFRGSYAVWSTSSFGPELTKTASRRHRAAGCVPPLMNLRCRSSTSFTNVCKKQVHACSQKRWDHSHPGRPAPTPQKGPGAICAGRGDLLFPRTPRLSPSGSHRQMRKSELCTILPAQASAEDAYQTWQFLRLLQARWSCRTNEAKP